MKRKHFFTRPFTIAGNTHVPLQADTARMPLLSSTTPINAMLDNDRVLVLIQLIGGNDGLSSIIPLGSYDNLAKHRGNILLKQNQCIKVSDNMAWHPALKSMADLLQANKLMAVHNVAYPNQNRSHFRSMDIWNSASPAKEQWSSGWLGRYLDIYHSGYPAGYPNENFPDPVTVSLGNIVSDTCQGKSTNFSYALTSLDNLDLLKENESFEADASSYTSEIAFLESTVTLTNKYSERVKAASLKGNSSAIYPAGNELAYQLKMVAKLISGGLRTKFYVLTLGGFDTHAMQVDKTDITKGQHTQLLTTLADAMKAFQTDLQLLGLEDRVLSMTYSEFGRQIKSNSAFGTDHGTAAPVFLFGKNLSSPFIGNLPVIPSVVNPQAGVDMQFDFRDVYASVLTGWIGATSAETRHIFKRANTDLGLVKA